MNENIRAWIDEIKQIERLNEIQKKRIIEFDNYFKYSGKIEKEKKGHEKFLKAKKIITNDPVVEFYFENSEYTIKEIAGIFGMTDNAIRARLNKHFDNNKKLKNGKNTENE